MALLTWTLVRAAAVALLGCGIVGVAQAACPTKADLDASGLRVSFADDRKVIYRRVSPDDVLERYYEKGELTGEATYRHGIIILNWMPYDAGNPNAADELVYLYGGLGEFGITGVNLLPGLDAFEPGAAFDLPYQMRFGDGFVGSLSLMQIAVAARDPVVLGDCSYPAIALTVVEGEGLDRYRTELAWLPEPGIVILIRDAIGSNDWTDAAPAVAIAVEPAE